MKSTSTSNRPILGVFLLAQSSYVVEAALLHCSAKDSGSHICWGLPKPCNFTVGKNNRSLFHVLRDLYSPAKSSVYHQCLGINTQHRLFAKIFWKAREFSCSISELWMSSVRVHWECLFPFLFCFWKMWCLFFFSIFLIGVLRLISQCLLYVPKWFNKKWKTPLVVATGAWGPKKKPPPKTEDQESLVQFLVQPGVVRNSTVEGLVGAKIPFLCLQCFNKTSQVVSRTCFFFFFFFRNNNSIIDIIDIIDIRYLFRAFELFPTCEKKTPPWFCKFLKHQLGHTLAKTLRWQSLQKRTLVYSWFAHCWNILLSMPRSVVLHLFFFVVGV